MLQVQSALDGPGHSVALVWIVSFEKPTLMPRGVALVVAGFRWALLGNFASRSFSVDQLHTAGAHSISHLPAWLFKLKPTVCGWIIHTHNILPYSLDASVASGMKLPQWVVVRPADVYYGLLLSSGNYVYYVQQIPICHMAYCACEVHHQDIL